MPAEEGCRGITQQNCLFLSGYTPTNVAARHDRDSWNYASDQREVL